MSMHPKVLGLILDQKLAYNTRIHNISVQAHIPLQMIKATHTISSEEILPPSLVATRGDCTAGQMDGEAGC